MTWPKEQMDPYTVGYAGAFSTINGITGITLDPDTGEINFTPTVQGAFVSSRVKIEEFDSTGTSLVG